MKRAQRALKAADEADPAQTARRMARALDYLMRVSVAAGLPRVTAKLAVAQAELLIASGQHLIDIDTKEARRESSQSRH